MFLVWINTEKKTIVSSYGKTSSLLFAIFFQKFMPQGSTNWQAFGIVHLIYRISRLKEYFWLFLSLLGKFVQVCTDWKEKGDALSKSIVGDRLFIFSLVIPSGQLIFLFFNSSSFLVSSCGSVCCTTNGFFVGFLLWLLTCVQLSRKRWSQGYEKRLIVSELGKLVRGCCCLWSILTIFQNF